jgi:glycerol-3-phosphate acyltransferase PlsY
MEQGTGNVGTLNTLRATGSKKLTALVLLGDSGKGALALLLSYLVALGFGHEPELLMQVGGLVAIVGHNYSAFLKLKGGKGLATALPVLLYLEPILVGVWVGAFLLSVATTRLMVMGQIMGTVAAAIVGAAAFGDSSIPVGILAALVFIKHAPRLRNVFNGTEPKMYYKIKEAGR